MSKKVGRPTKYNEEMQRKADEYIKNAVPENMDLPTIEGLALELGVNDDQIIEYQKKYPKFHATYRKLKMLQKKYLMIVGLFGGKEINVNMAMFLLKANCGMMETSKQILEGSDEKPLIILDTEPKK